MPNEPQAHMKAEVTIYIEGEIIKEELDTER